MAILVLFKIGMGTVSIDLDYQRSTVFNTHYVDKSVESLLEAATTLNLMRGYSMGLERSDSRYGCALRVE